MPIARETDAAFTRNDVLGYAGLTGLAVVTLGIARALTPAPAGFGTHEQLGLPPCAFLHWTGFPCPSCGLTTCFAHAAHRSIRRRLSRAAVRFARFRFDCVADSLRAVVHPSPHCVVTGDLRACDEPDDARVARAVSVELGLQNLRNERMAMTRHLLLVLLLLSTPPMARIPPDDKLKTRAELSNYEETSRYEDVMNFIGELQKRTPLLRVESFGKTEEGRELPLMIFADPPVAQPRESLASGKAVIFIMANIHAGEVEGKEAILHLSRRIAFGDLKPLLNPTRNFDRADL